MRDVPRLGRLLSGSVVDLTSPSLGLPCDRCTPQVEPWGVRSFPQVRPLVLHRADLSESGCRCKGDGSLVDDWVWQHPGGLRMGRLRAYRWIAGFIRSLYLPAFFERGG